MVTKKSKVQSSHFSSMLTLFSNANKRPLLTRIISRLFHVQVDKTPNQNSFKFSSPELTERLHASKGTLMEFGDLASASRSPLAHRILSLPSINSVYFGTDFVTVEKKLGVEVKWEQLKPQICSIIVDFVNSGQDIMEQGEREHASIPSDDPELLEHIITVMDSRVRPVVQGDGGDIEVVGLKEGFVSLRLRGACKSCSSSTITLRNGVERMLMHYIEGVKGVIHVKDAPDEISESVFEEFEFEQNSREKSE